MTDKELLELAAKAYGLPLGNGDGEYRYFEDGPLGSGMYGRKGSTPLYWSSIDNYGDALRLAAALPGGVEIRICGGSVNVSVKVGSEDSVYVHQKRSDSTKALRRAITRAAAEIARATDTGGEA